MSRPATPVDFQRLFAAIPAAIMVLRPDAPHFTIAAASDALLRHAGAKLEDLVGRSLFDAVPEPPDDANNGPGALRASLARVLATGEPDAMPVARYDVRRSDGVFEERYWMPVNAPLFGAGLGLDSIDALELVVMLEKNYGVVIKDIEQGRPAFVSVRALADFIDAKRPA